jgi:hypothetical protein
VGKEGRREGTSKKNKGYGTIAVSTKDRLVERARAPLALGPRASKFVFQIRDVG